MSWRNPQHLPFTRLDIAAALPSESGVYSVFDGEYCLMVGEAWNLKARLLELANVLSDLDELTIIYELCPETERPDRYGELMTALAPDRPSFAPTGYPAWPEDRVRA